MAMNDFVRRSMQIVAGGIAQSTTDYFDNAISFANDVKEVIDMGKQMGSDGAKKFNELKSSGILKKTRDWFYNEGGMFGDFDFDDDDFDAGFEIDSADSDSKGDQSQPLSKDMMTDIAKKQTGAMYKAFGRQADLQIANTAEIISTINTRTAELTASVNNVNNTLIQIGKRLDLIVEWTSARTKKEEEQLKKASILDYGGGISLSGLAAKAKENAEDSMLGTMLSIGKTMLGSGMMTPEMVLSTILSQTLLDKKFDKLGGKSVNDIGEFINDTVGEAIQNSLTKILKTKKEPFADIFEDLLSRGSNRNYQNSVANQYNDKPAVFDGMTRKSIITIIPGYLNEILKAVSGGQGMNVDNKGNLKAGTGANSFVKAVSENYFKSGTMDWKQREKASVGTGLTTTEVANAVRTLTGSWIWSMYAYDIVVLDVGQIKDMSNPVTKEVVNDAAKAMASVDPKHRSVEKWISLYKGIIYEIDEFKYRQELQRSAERADKNLEDFAKHHVNNHQAGKVDTNVWMAAFKDMYKEYNGSSTTTTTPSSVSPSPIGGSASPLSITELDYMAGVFDRLNRGINVFVTGHAKNRSTQYKKIRMIPGYAKRAMGAGVSSSDDPDRPEGGPTIPGPAGKIVEKVFKPKDSALRKAAAETSPALAEAIDRVAAGEGTPDDKAAVEEFKKEYNKPTNFIKRTRDTIKSGWNKYADESRKMGIVADPEGYAMVDDMVGKVKGLFSEVLSDRAKNVFTKAGSNEKYQEVVNGKGVQEAKSGVNRAANKVVDVFAGKRSVDENGEAIRTGGLIHNVVSKGTNLSNTIRGGIKSNKRLNEEWEDILSQFGADNHFEENDSDSLNMQLIVSSANTAMTDGNVSTMDIQNIQTLTSKLSDRDLQRRINQTVIPMMKRNAKGEKDNSSGDAPKSTMGKLLKMALGGLKLFLAPVIGYIKVVLFSVFKIIKGFGGAILKFAKWGIMRGLRQIKYGMKSLGFGIKTMFKSMTKFIKPMVDGLYKAVTTIKDGVTKAFSNIGKSIKDKVGGWMEKRGIKDKLNKDLTVDENGNKKKGILGKLSGAKEGLANKFAERPGFMKGFTKAYRDRKEAEHAADVKKQGEPARQAIDDSKATGFLETIKDVVSDIKTAVTGKKEEKPSDVISTDVQMDSAAADAMNESMQAEEDKLAGFQEEMAKNLANITEIVSWSGSPDAAPGFVQSLTQSLNDLGEGIQDKMDEESKEIQDASGGSDNPLEGVAGDATEATKDAVLNKTLGGSGGGSGAAGIAMTAATGGAGGAAAEGAAAGAAEAGAAEGAGAAMGGMMNVLMGISNIVLTIVMSLEGFKAMISTVTDILTEALMPLNDAFHAIIKTLKPYVKQLGSIVKQLAGFIVQIVEVVCDIIQPIMKDVIQPILEVLSPLLESIIGCLTPLLKIVGILLKVILAPLMGLFKFVLLPILKIIGDAVQIIMGVLQIGFGVLMMGIGGIITAIGTVISAVGKLIPGVGKLGSGIKDSGKSMMKEGGDFVAQGLKQVAQGTVNLVLDYASLYSMGMTDELLGRNEEEKKETKQIEAPDGNQVESTFANGDITNVYNTYGGEYQRGMGGYLNMNQRGCGPIALADMYNRNSEGRISARSLAGMMNQSGAYDPHRGTSVGDYIDTARGLGMNVRAGKVTQQSLKSASPTNPITVVGSGSDYGTRNGNNHFMNVVGTDHHGGAYVSNPLTGRIDRRPASTVAGSAVMGIYGSGDEEEGGYTFPEAIKEAFKKLKEEAAKILGLFSMEKSEEEETEDTINAERKKSAAEQAKKQLMNDDPDGYAEIEEAAKAKAKEDYFIKKYPQRDNESDEEYQERFDEWWEGDADQAKWLTESGQFTDALKKAKGNSKAAWQELANKSNEFVEGYANQFEELGKQADAAEEGLGSSGGNGSGGYFTSQGGNARLALDNPEITDIDMTDVDSSIGDGGGYSHAPVLEFFKKTGGAQSFLYGYNMYNQYGTSSPSDHTKEGVGTAGSTHQGIDLHWIGESAEGKIPVYAPTDGKLQLAQPEALAAGGGNYVSMIDNEGNRHRFMHMHHFSDEIKNMKFGDQIIGGKTILGYEGNTGDSTGTHTHWDIYEDGGSGKRLNPLTYFSNYVPSSNLEGGTDEEKIWAYLTSHGLEKHAAAGAMGAFQVESANNPDTLEGYYAFGDGSRSNSVVKEAMKSFDSMDDYVVNKLFPMYDRSGKSINKPGYKGTDGHYYPGLGLAQWTGDRTVALSKYTVGKGLGWNDLGGQLDYLKHELDTNSYYSGAVTEMNNSNDVNRATEIWLAKFEGNPGDALSERQKYANDFYNRFKDWTPQTKQTYTPTGSGSASTGFGMVNSAADARMVDNYNQIKTTSGKNTGTVLTGGDDLNMRADKSIDSSVLITIPNGTKLNLEASGSAGWFKTTWGGKTGYVSSEYIILDNDDANNFDYSGGLQDKSADALLTTYAKEATGQNVDGELNMINPIMWDADNWLAPKSNATERQKWYAQLAQIHSNAIKNNQLAYTQKYKDAWTWNWQNGQKVTPDNPDYWQSMTVQMSGDQHYSNLGSGKSNVDLTWNGVKDEAYAGGNSLLKKWKKGKDVKAYKGNGVYADAIKKRLGTQLGEINGLRKDWSSWTYGSGDEPMSELDFWDSYLGWNNKYANSNITTPVNNDLYDTDTYYDTETGTTVVNNYAVTRAEDRATDARLKAVLANTYNVRSESMEALLEAILEELKRRKDGKPGPTNTSGSSKLFDERIPSQVTKLSVG